MAKEWTVRVNLDDSGDAVVATATLVDEDEGTLSATGRFRPAHPDSQASRIQYELAAARALQRLSDALINAAAQRA
ncbi:MAG: dsRBD fold-containing protein [Kibdelosporangium sp.]